MKNEEKQKFFDEFMAFYLSMGLGNLPKREIDLFVFNYLFNSSDYKGKNNYELAVALKIPESRIKSLRLNSALQHQPTDPRSILTKIANRLSSGKITIEIVGEKIELPIEDPVEKMELINFIKQHNRHISYTFNSEALLIDPWILAQLLIKYAKVTEKNLNMILHKHIDNKILSEDILSNSLSLKDKFTKLRKQVTDTNTIVSILQSVFTLIVD